MTTILALAQARHQQALTDLQAAEQELLQVMASIAPIPAIGIVDGILPRRFEALLEGERPFWELSAAYAAYRRAQRAEARARSAAHRARFAEEAPAMPKPKSAPRRRPRTFAEAIAA